MKTKFTMQEITAALAIQAKIEAGHKAASAKLDAIVGDKKHVNGLTFEEVKFSAPFRAAKAECAKWHEINRQFAKKAGKYLLGAMRYVSNPERYPECAKYMEGAK